MLRALGLALCLNVCAILCASVSPGESQRSCNNPGGVFQISRGKKHFFQKDENFQVHVEGDFDKDITKGSYTNVQLKVGLLDLPRMRYDTCEFLEQYNIHCPFAKGHIERQENINIDFDLPGGEVKGSMDVYTKDGEFITCVKIIPA